MLTACSRPTATQHLDLKEENAIQGGKYETVDLPPRKGDVVRIVLEQSGLDLELKISDLEGRVLGTFDSFTERYGEDRVQIKVEQDRPLKLTFGAPRSPEVSGRYRLTVTSVESEDPAEADFSTASSKNDVVGPGQRIQRFESAHAKFVASGRIREAGVAALAATILLNDTASDSKEAVEHGEKAVAALRKTDAPLLQATALMALAMARVEATNAERKRRQDRAKDDQLPEEMYDGEKRLFDESRRLFESQGAEVGVAEVDLNRHVLNVDHLDDQTRLDKLIDVSRRCDQLNEHVCDAVSVTSAGILLRDLRDYARAIDAAQVARELVDESVDTAAFAMASDNLAFLRGLVGDFDAAILHHQKALKAFAKFGECSGVSRSYYGLGYTLLRIGDYPQTMRFFDLALGKSCNAATLDTVVRDSAADARSIRALCQRASRSVDSDTEDRETAAWIAWDIGNLARAQSDPQTALACHDIAAGLATTRNRLFGIQLERVRDLDALGRYSEARTAYAELAPKVDSVHAWYQAHARDVEALLMMSSGDAAGAIDRLGVAAEAYHNEWQFDAANAVFAQRAALAASRMDPRTDEFFADADEALEYVRLLSLDPAYSASLFATGRRIYGDWISSMSSRRMDATLTLATLALSERSRNRLLLQVANPFELGKKARDTVPQRQSANTQELRERLEAARKGESEQENAATVEGVDSRSDIARGLGIKPNRFSTDSRQEMMDRLRGYQLTLDKGTTAIEYLLGEEVSHAWVLRNDSLTHVELPRAALIRAAARDARQALETGAPLDVTRKSLASLYELVYKPLEASVQGNALKIVLDDALHEIPFAALWDADQNRYLVEHATITYLPSLQFAYLRNEERIAAPDPPATLLIGDPVYELADARDRCSETAQAAESLGNVRLRRLPASGREVEALKAQLTAGERKFETLTGCEATRERVLGRDLGRFRYIHFATHATADAVAPQQSAIYLSAFDAQGKSTSSALTAADFLEHPLNADLVVLSGCSTAGGRRYGGEGALGLSFSIVARGSRNVISTLWPVADAASVVAMEQLYAGLIANKQTMTQALRSTQLEMLRSKRWNHPRNWAAYSLLGT